MSAGEVTAPEANDPWLLHFFRFFCIGALVLLSCAVIVGLPWVGWIFRRTGYRARSLLWLIVPIIGPSILVTSTWRYTARSVYWSERPEASAVLGGVQRPWLIGAGATILALAVPAVVVGSAPARFDAPLEAPVADGWTTTVEAEHITLLEETGWEPRRRASCAVGYLQEQFPEGPPGDEVSEAQLSLVLARAADICR